MATRRKKRRSWGPQRGGNNPMWNSFGQNNPAAGTPPEAPPPPPPEPTVGSNQYDQSQTHQKPVSLSEDWRNKGELSEGVGTDAKPMPKTGTQWQQAMQGPDPGSGARILGRDQHASYDPVASVRNQGHQARLNAQQAHQYRMVQQQSGQQSQWDRQRLAGEQSMEQLSGKGGWNAALAAQQQQFNLANMDASTQANLQLGGAQQRWQQGLNQQAANLNIGAAREQANLNRQQMGYGAELGETAAQATAGRNIAAQEHAAGLTEDAAQSTFGRNQQMQQMTHGLNQETMQNQFGLQQQGAQAAQDRGFAGVNKMQGMMFGQPGTQGGGMFGQMMNQFGGGQQGGQGGGAAPQFGGIGNFAQSGAGQQVASQYGTNPYQAAMASMSGGQPAPPPGAAAQGPMGANAQMMANQNMANQSGMLAGQVAQQGQQFNLGAMGGMANAGAAAGQLAATQSAPALGARSALQAGAINAMGQAAGGVA